MKTILDLVTADGRRLVEVMHLHLFRPTLDGVNLGVVTCIDPHVDRATPVDRFPYVTLRVWDNREAVSQGHGYKSVREENGMSAWYSCRDEALMAHVVLVQNKANAMVQRALESIGK